MTNVIAFLILGLIIFFLQWIFSLALDRVNRRTAKSLAESMTVLIEVDNYIKLMIEDLRRLQPERDEILEIMGLQLDNLQQSATTQRQIMEIMSTKRSPFSVFLPVATAAAKQKRRHAERAALSEKAERLLDEGDES